MQASGVLDGVNFEPLREAAKQGLDAFAEAFMAAAMENLPLLHTALLSYTKRLGSLYLKRGGCTVLWFSCQMAAQKYPKQIRAAGYEGDGPQLGNALFQAIMIVMTVLSYKAST